MAYIWTFFLKKPSVCFNFVEDIFSGLFNEIVAKGWIKNQERLLATFSIRKTSLLNKFPIWQCV